MSNNHSFYFGAYLQITTKQLPVMKTLLVCWNDHRPSGSPRFCPECGSRVEKETVEGMRHPTIWDIGLMMSDEFEESLAEITPPCLYNKGTVILKSNFNFDGVEWLELNGSGYGDLIHDQMGQFPTDKEVQSMKDVFASEHGETVALIQAIDFVTAASVKCGYVLNADY